MRKKKETHVPNVPGKPTKSGHYMGKRTGFELRDGKYFIDPVHRSTIDDVLLEYIALQTFIDAMNRHVHGEVLKLKRREKEFWDRLCDDLGLERTDRLLYENGAVYYADEKSEM